MLPMFHSDILTISYKHRYEIKKVFQEILGIYGIEHFSLDLVRPDGEMIFLSATPSHGYEICSRGFGQYDGAISPEYYQNFEFYWWKDTKHKAFGEQIDYLRHVKHGFKHGFMLVRKWDDFHLIYSFATRNSDPHFPSLVINKLNELLSAGDHVYNEMRHTYTEYTGEWQPPEIEKFYPFQGGRPVNRYSRHYIETQNGVLVNDDTVVQPDGAQLSLVVDNS